METELIRVIDYEVDSHYNYIRFSIYNGSLHSIKDIKILVNFYKGTWDGTRFKHVHKQDYPLHFEEIKIIGIIPSRLTKRIDDKIYINVGGSWVPEFRVLGYKIVK